MRQGPERTSNRFVVEKKIKTLHFSIWKRILWIPKCRILCPTGAYRWRIQPHQELWALSDPNQNLVSVMPSVFHKRRTTSFKHFCNAFLASFPFDFFIVIYKVFPKTFAVVGFAEVFGQCVQLFLKKLEHIRFPTISQWLHHMMQRVVNIVQGQSVWKCSSMLVMVQIRKDS